MALKFRSIDGSNNNRADPAMNQAGTDFTRAAPANFADGFLEMTAGRNPREISNIVVAGDGDVVNPEGLSGMMYAWGQFIDHDLDLANSDGVTHINITVPPGDPNFIPGSVIALTRAIVDATACRDRVRPRAFGGFLVQRRNVAAGGLSHSGVLPPPCGGFGCE